MLDQIINLVKEQGTEYFKKQTNVPDEQAEQAAETAGESIFEGLKEQVLSGNFEGVKDLLSGNSNMDSGNPIVKQIMDMFSSKLSNQSGVTAETAETASEGGIPALLQSVIAKFTSKDSADSDFDVAELAKSVMGDKIEDTVEDLKESIGGMLGGFFGKK
ncbi:MAG: hypothetical protein ACPGVB_02380 [Chitinophagales bacterium]